MKCGGIIRRSRYQYSLLLKLIFHIYTRQILQSLEYSLQVLYPVLKTETQNALLTINYKFSTLVLNNI